VCHKAQLLFLSNVEKTLGFFSRKVWLKIEFEDFTNISSKQNTQGLQANLY